MIKDLQEILSGLNIGWQEVTYGDGGRFQYLDFVIGRVEFTAYPRANDPKMYEADFGVRISPVVKIEYYDLRDLVRLVLEIEHREWEAFQTGMEDEDFDAVRRFESAEQRAALTRSQIARFKLLSAKAQAKAQARRKAR